MTIEQAKEILAIRQPCGCVTHYDESPPYTWGCDKHIFPIHAAMPTLWREAWAVLRKES